MTEKEIEGPAQVIKGSCWAWIYVAGVPVSEEVETPKADRALQPIADKVNKALAPLVRKAKAAKEMAETLKSLHGFVKEHTAKQAIESALAALLQSERDKTREECAKIAEELSNDYLDDMEGTNAEEFIRMEQGYVVSYHLAQAIRKGGAR